ncbi:MAG: SoxY-related AACIE arm protein [Rhodoferax sp.]|jgi:sulfur-oxidizing protein SoxY|nr:SoxY-related AACIE arm protein [Rhodoferax sp.]
MTRAQPSDGPAQGRVAGGLSRRKLLAAGVVAGVGMVHIRSVQAAELAAAVAAFTAGAPLREGRVTLDIAQLVDNGNAVPVTVSVASPMTPADHVVALALFNERNPQRDVFTTRLGPRSGRARVSSRIRLATSQKLVAVARMNDGSCWTKTVDVIVTLAACIEGET